MTDQDPKPGVVIDVTPENESASGFDADTPAGAPQTVHRSNGIAWLALLLALGAMAGTAVLAVFGYHQLGRLNQDIAVLDGGLDKVSGRQAELGATIGQAVGAARQQQDQLAQQREVLARQRLAYEEARAAFQQQERQLADENLRWHEREAELRAVVADVHQRVGRSGTQWYIAETEYLLRIATDRLALARDVETARVALELADQRLRDTRDPGWVGVREQIARDIAALSAFEEPDIAGLSGRLATMIGQTPQLKLTRAGVAPRKSLSQHEPRAPAERRWDTLLDDLWAGFKGAVRIREHDKPVQALLGPEHELVLYENLKLHLETARLALARLDPALFRDSLSAASDWLMRYFVVTEETATALSVAIGELKAIDIRPPLPDVSKSLRALKARQSLMVGVAPRAADPQ